MQLRNENNLKDIALEQNGIAIEQLRTCAQMVMINSYGVH